MKKRRLLPCLLIISILASMFAWTITVEAAASGDYEYTVNADGTTRTITKYTGSGGTVTIPRSLDGHTVTSVQGALKGCDLLTNVTIPNSVTSIGNNQFIYSSSLANVYFDGNMPSIELYSFLACSSSLKCYYPSRKSGYSYG